MRLARFRDWPLRWKLLGLLAAASAVPIAVTTVLGFRASSAQIRRSATVVLGARGDQLANEVDAFNAAFLFAAERLASLPEVVDFCGLPKERRARSEGRMSATLSTFGGADPRTHLVALLDAGGTVTASTNPAIRGRNYALRRYVQTAVAGRAAISDVFISVVGARGAPSIAYASPVRGGSGVVAGVALVVARGESLWDLLADHNGSAGPGTYSVLFDAYGIRIAHSYKRDDVFHPAAPLDAATISAFVSDRRFGDDTRRLLEGVVPMPEEFSRVKSGNAGGEFMAYAPTNQAVNLGVGRRLKTVPWTVFYLVPKTSLDAPVRQVLQQSLAANGAILGFALAAGLLLARSILFPVQSLTHAARAIREGDLSPNVSVPSQDELGELASAFESMAASLRAGREQLEEKVRVRTEALESAMDSLEAQNQALAQRTAELTSRQQRDVAYGRAVTALAGEGSLVPVLKAALRDAATFAGAAVIACYRVSGQKLTPIAQVGLAPEGSAASLAVGGAAEEAFRSRRPVVLDPLPEGVELRFDAVLAAGRARAVALVPLLAGQHQVGLMAAGAFQSLEPAAVDFLSDLALPLALTIVRHDLHTQTNEFAEQLAKSNEELHLQTEELQAQRQDLEKKNVQIKKADQLKSEFLANMSHELRTPLNAIIGFSELLLEEARSTLTAEHKRFVEDVLASGRHLLALINDILDLTKIESGRLDLQLESLAPGDAVGEAVSLVAPQAQRKRIQIRSRIETATPVHADRGKLRQILLNLIANAVKFSESGTNVEVGAEEVPSAVRFWVRDEGPGMDPALVGRLFQPFVQGDSTLVKKHQGTGLGLAISRRLTEEHGGAIEVSSAPGKGSTFSVSIPTLAAVAPWAARAGLTGPAPSAAAVPASSTPVASGRQRALVLLVEDDVSTVRLVRAFVRDAGYELAEASNCADALQMAKRLHPAAVLLDLDLDGEDGLDLLKALKEDPTTRGIPVIIESVLAEQKRGLLVGASDYLVKPLDRTRLLETLGRVRRADSAGAEPLVLAIDDDPVVSTILRTVLAPAGFRLKTASLGKEGLEIARREQPAVIIVDLLLPDISGFEVVERLAADPRTARLPVIALTGANLSAKDRKRLENRVSSLAQKGDFTRESVLLAVQRARGAAPDQRGAIGPTMLVVDDHDLNRELIRTFLERKGYRVLLADSGEAGIEIARREQPSLILLDLAMPGKDGFATARELRADEVLGRTPLVAVTAMAMRSDEERAREAGFDAYVTKPVDRRILEETVERLLKRPA